MNRLSRGFNDIVRTRNGNYVFIDSRDTLDKGYETMVFECNENGVVDNWLELDVARYKTIEEMTEGHVKMIYKWKDDAYGI